MIRHSFFSLAFCGMLALVHCGRAQVPVDGGVAEGAVRGRAEIPETFVNFSFDQVDIRFLVKLVGDLTGRRFVIDREIDRKVTVVTPPRIAISEVYPLFLSILEASGCSVVERNGVHHVVPREPRLTPIVPVVGPGETMPEQGLITKVIRLSNLNAADVRMVLEPMVRGGKTGSLGVLEATNHLIITDTADSLRRIEEIIAQIDLPGMTQITEVHKLRHANARDMANELNAAISGARAVALTPGEQLRRRLPQPADGRAASSPSDAVVVAAPHSNSIILVGPPMQVRDLKRLVEEMDVEPDTGFGHLRAIFLKYLSSEDAAKSLTALLTKNADAEHRQRISIEPNAGNNALLIDAAPQDFEMVRALVEQLDHPPKQVLVEVIFAEITVGEGIDIGVEFLAAGTPSEGSTLAIGGMRTAEEASSLMENVMSGIVPGGLTFGLVKGSYTDSEGNVVPSIPVLMNLMAMQEKSHFKILSSVPLWTQNNQEASVNIGKNIPILKSTIAGGSGTARDIIETIERIDVGIKLTVMPHINPNNEVMMKLNPSIEAIIETATSGKSFTPTIAKREVTTTLTVPNHQTIVISGLIREDSIMTERKIPLLGSIPLIGWLFRHKIESVERTNLLIFVTPHVVVDMSDAIALTDALRAKTGITAGASDVSGESATGE